MSIPELVKLTDGLRRLPMSQEAFEAMSKLESPYRYLYTDGMAYEVSWTVPIDPPQIVGCDGIPMILEAFEVLDEIEPNYNYQMAGGVVYNMITPSSRHYDIVENIHMVCRQQLGMRKPRRAYREKAAVVKSGKPRVEPDVVVTCNADDRKDLPSLKFGSPRVVIEVLSPSTEQYDRGEKFEYYKSFTSLEVYILANQDEPLIEVYRRDREWGVEYYRSGEVIQVLEEPALKLAVDDVYDGVLDV